MVDIYIRRADRRADGRVSRYTSCKLFIPRQDVGRWTIVTRDAATAAAMLPPMNAAGKVTARRGVLIRSNGETVESGWCEGKPQIAHTAEGTEWTFTGQLDTSVMNVRCWPVPANDITNQTQAHYSITAARSDMIRDLVLRNVSQRLGVPGVVVGNALGLGAVRTRRIRFDNLITISQAIGGRTVNFAVRQRDFDGSLFLYTWLPPDRRDSIVFTPQTGQVESWSHEVAPPTITRVVMGAGGEGTERKFRLFVNTADEAVYGVIETFKDRRDLNPAEPGWDDELASDADDFLAESASRPTFEINTLGVGYRYGIDYRVGDLVRAYTGQDQNSQPINLVEDLIEEATVTWSKEGERAELVIGAAEGRNLPTPTDKIAALETRF